MIWWQWIVPLFVALTGVKLLVEPRLKGVAGERKVAKLLAEAGGIVRNDVLLPDGRGGLIQVDHLVLAPSGIWAIETKNYGGIILGQTHQKRWTQKMGERDLKVPEPPSPELRPHQGPGSLAARYPYPWQNGFLQPRTVPQRRP